MRPWGEEHAKVGVLVTPRISHGHFFLTGFFRVSLNGLSQTTLEEFDNLRSHLGSIPAASWERSPHFSPESAEIEPRSHSENESLFYIYYAGRI